MVAREVLNAVAFGGLTAAWGAPAALIAPLGKVSRRVGPTLTRIASRWSRDVLDACGVDVVIEDFDRPLDAPAYLVVANHTSHMDVLAIFARFPRDLYPVAKRELAYVPIFGWALAGGAAIMIDRGDRKRAKASIDRAGRAIRGGRSVLMFPEGTRTAGLELGPFKKGPFHLAMAARVPVLPIGVIGASEVLRPGDWKIRSNRTITVRMGRPLPVDGYPAGAPGREQLAADVQVAIGGLLERRDPP